jgi:hypothetical protein
MAGSLPRRHALKLLAASTMGMVAATLGWRGGTAQAATCTCQPINGTLKCIDSSTKKLCSNYCGMTPYGCPDGKKAGDPCTC